MLCISRVCAQDLQNANWIFNKAWLEFTGLTTPIALTGVPDPLPPDPDYPGYVTQEGCASVSDAAGTLLFFTDGYDAYYLNGGALTAFTNNASSPAMLGHNSSAQNTIIIPKPSDSDKYYIVTLVGATSMSPAVKGLYYTEVDVSNHTYTTGIQNIVLDDGSADIDDTYGNISEALTSVLAQDGINYWLVAHIENNSDSNILTYSVTSSGISLAQSYGLTADGAYSLSLKISPDRSRFALCQRFVNPIIGTFDNVTGAVTSINLTPVGGNPSNVYCYSADFSPNSQNLYYTRAVGTSGNGILGIRVDAPATEYTIDSNSDSYGVQRALNERVYIARKGQTFVTELQTPNDILSPGLSTVSLSGRTAPGAIPQWIWSTCIATLEDYNDITSVELREEEREQWIRNYSFVNIGGRGIYHAGNFVEMLPGFEADYGSDYVAYIEGCSQDFQYRPGAVQPKTGSEASPINGIKIFPNPTNSLLNITTQNQNMININILTIDGKMLHTQVASGTEQQLDVSQFANGVYLIIVQTLDGQTHNTKFIKN